MQNQQNLLDGLKKLLTHKKSKAFYAKKLGCSIEKVNFLLNELRGTKTEYGVVTNKKYNVDEGELEINSYYQEEPSAEEIIKDHNIDESKYKLSSYWSKGKEKGWQVSACFTKNSKNEEVLDSFKEWLQNYKSPNLPIPTPISSKYSDKCALISLPDAHIDKLTLDGESIDKKIETYYTVLYNLVNTASNAHKLEEIVFVIGNDFYHTDSVNNTTTKGTPLDVNTSWDNAYTKGFDLMVKSIMLLKTKCKELKVILMQGNHPFTKEFYLAHALEVYFSNDANIIFDRVAKNLKVHQYGETLLCFNHGNNVNDKLPLAFATTFYKEWGQCKYKEIIIGDKHHNNEKLFRSQGEAFGVRMRILPSLSNSDKWHNDNLFINSLQSGICIVYDKVKGKVSEFEERI